MLLSMTGHGAALVQRGDMSVAVEVRTINSRYFKLSVRASDGFAAIESRVDEVVRRFIRRGTVQVDVRVEQQVAPEHFTLNEVVLAGYQQQLQQINERLQANETVPLHSLLILPGVVRERMASTTDLDSDWPIIAAGLEQSLEHLTRMRSDEGQAMAADLCDNCQTISAELSHVEERAPLVAEHYRNRLTERINRMLPEYKVQVEPADLVREVGLFAERSDISEETVRLRSHLDQFDSIMKDRDGGGRKLEFVTQEMFREANTIGSKANDAEIAHHVIEIKAAIERIREMVQNVE
ncbi:MAG: YicC/YloC family endoribonuclease [Pirellulaceae bacterium]